VAFTPDGKRVLTGSVDRTARLWDANTGRELCQLLNFKDGTWAVTDAQGRFDAANNGDISGLHWTIGDKTFPLSRFKKEFYSPGLLGKYMGWNEQWEGKSGQVRFHERRAVSLACWVGPAIALH
jgi:WD40 repeat protein